MHNNTQQNIFEFIRKNQGVSVKGIISHSALNATGIFRHLKKLQERGRVYKVGKPPHVLYYSYAMTMDTRSHTIQNALDWAVSGDERLAPSGERCQTRDVFDARYYRLFDDLKKIQKNEDIVSLIMAAVGEIGNNSFDHNLGRWRDIPGIVFAFDEVSRSIALADRGVGVLATLQRVRPNIKSDTEALRVAFTEVVSGRAPENRGNGLKLVKKVIEENHLYLEFSTGMAKAIIDGNGMTVKKSDANIPGTFAYITF